MLEYAGFCDYCMFECAILSFQTLTPPLHTAELEMLGCMFFSVIFLLKN